VVQSVQRAAKILKCFTPNTSELGVTEIASRLGLAKSVVHGLLITLEAEGLLSRNRSGKYTLGPGLFGVAEVFRRQMNIAKVAFPVMEDIHRKTNETIFLAKRVGKEVCCIEIIKSKLPLIFNLEVGHRFPLGAGATGKLLLAFLPSEERERIIENLELKRLTPKTVVDVHKLIQQLEQIRRRGYEVTYGERFLDVVSVVAPIRDSSGRVVAALGLGAAKARASEEAVSRWVALVTKGARQVSYELGWMADETFQLGNSIKKGGL